MTDHIFCFRSRRGFIRIPSLAGTEKQANSSIFRLTCGQIASQFMIGDFTESTSIVASSGYYVRPVWAQKNYFARRVNAPYPFWKTTDGKVHVAPTFTCYAQPEYRTDEHCRVVGLELEGTNHTIYFVVPNYPDDTGLRALRRMEEALDGQYLLRIVESVAGQRNINHRHKMMVSSCSILPMPA